MSSAYNLWAELGGEMGRKLLSLTVDGNKICRAFLKCNLEICTQSLKIYLLIKLIIS